MADPFDYKAYASEMESKYSLPAGSYLKLLDVGERSGETATSPKGAYGRAQLMPDTAREMGMDPHDPKQNLEGGAKYLKAMYDRFGGDISKAYAAYNEGPAGHGVPNNPETRKYVGRLMGESGDTGGGGVDMQALMRAPGGPDNPQTKELQKEGMSALKDSKSAHAEAAKGYSEDIDRYEKMLAEHSPEIPIPPTLKDLPKPLDQKDYIKDPTRVMQQFLPMLAVLGSAFTRRGATTAMSAAAEAMTAAKQNDKDSFERAHETWKDSMQKTLDEWKMESDRYRDALENTKLSAEERQQKLQVAAALSNSRYMRESARTGNFDAIWKALQMGDTAWYKNMQVMNMTQRTDIERQIKQGKLQQQETYNTALKELREEPDYQQADALGRAKLEAQLTRQLMPNFPEKQAQMARQIRRDLENSHVGKTYGSVETYEPLIEDAASKVEGKHFWDENPLSSSEQAAFLEGFTRMVTGGQAIRGFTLKLNTEHASLGQKAARLLQSAKIGGPLSVGQIKDMIKVGREYASQIAKQYDTEQANADKYGESIGLGADATKPFSAGSLDIGGDTPSPTNVPAGGKPPAPPKYEVGQIIEHGGKKYRVTGGDLNDPDIEPVGGK